MNYLKLYQERNLKDLHSTLWDLNKILRANQLCERKVTREEFEDYKSTRLMLEQLYTLNLENISKALELAEKNSICLDTLHLETKYKTIAKSLNFLETLITDIFYNMDKYFEFYNEDTKAYAYGSFENLMGALNSDQNFIRYLIDTLNLNPNFNYKLSSKKHLEFLDDLSHPFLSVLRGIYEFLNQNDLIDLSLLDRKRQIASERANNIFGYHNGYNTPEAPKVLIYSKPNKKVIEQLPFPNLFEILDKYIICIFSDRNVFDDKMEIIGEEESSEYIPEGYMGKVLGNHDPLSKEKL